MAVLSPRPFEDLPPHVQALVQRFQGQTPTAGLNNSTVQGRVVDFTSVRAGRVAQMNPGLMRAVLETPVVRTPNASLVNRLTADQTAPQPGVLVNPINPNETATRVNASQVNNLAPNGTTLQQPVPAVYTAEPQPGFQFDPRAVAPHNTSPAQGLRLISGPERDERNDPHNNPAHRLQGWEAVVARELKIDDPTLARDVVNRFAEVFEKRRRRHLWEAEPHVSEQDVDDLRAAYREAREARQHGTAHNTTTAPKSTSGTGHAGTVTAVAQPQPNAHPTAPRPV